MSGLSIDHGGAISVDPSALRAVGTRMDAATADYEAAVAALIRAHRIIVDTPGFSAQVDTVGLWTAGRGVERLLTECRESAASTLLMADAYEYVELAVSAHWLASVDATAADALRARMEQLAADPRVPGTAAELIAQWQIRRFDGLEPPLIPGIVFGGPVWLAALLGLSPMSAAVRPGAALRGGSDPVTVAPVATTSPRTPPTSIAGSLSRMPTATGAQIAVEKYSYADGRTKFVAYIVGTRTVAAGGSEPWDMKSNTELYTGQASASYQATLDALAAAGAGPGDEVDIVAHSQAGMIAAYLSTSSDFDVRVQISAGSPTQVIAGEDQLVVGLVHTDDPVAALAGGGTPAGAGSPDSFTVTREADPDAGMDYWPMDAHGLETYIETAKMIDASGDPRVEALGDFWAELGEAETIERTEYRAERTEAEEGDG